MNPLAALPDPAASLAPAAPTGSGDAGSGDATGFADALHRASGTSRPDAPGPRAAQSRKDRSVQAEVESSDTSMSQSLPANSPADRPAGMGDAHDKASAAVDDDEADPDHAANASDGPGNPGTPAMVPPAGAPTTGAAASPNGQRRAGAATASPDASPGDTQGIESTRGRPTTPGARGAAAVGDGTARGSAERVRTGQPGIVTGDRATASGPAASTSPDNPGPDTMAHAGANAATGLATRGPVLPGTAANLEGETATGAPGRRRGAGTVIGRGIDGIGRLDPAAARSLATGTATPDLAAGAAAGTAREALQGIGSALERSDRGFEDLLASIGPGAGPDPAATTSLVSPGSSTPAGGVRPIALPIATPVYSPAFPQALGQQLAMALRMDLGQAELILSPAELGPVRVELSLDGDSASVQFAAIHPETRQALEQSLPNLRALFAEQGLSLTDTHVGPGFHRGGGDERSDTPARRGPGRSPALAIDGAIRPMSAPIRPDALVDLFA